MVTIYAIILSVFLCSFYKQRNDLRMMHLLFVSSCYWFYVVLRINSMCLIFLWVNYRCLCDFKIWLGIDEDWVRQSCWAKNVDEGLKPLHYRERHEKVRLILNIKITIYAHFWIEFCRFAYCLYSMKRNIEIRTC